MLYYTVIYDVTEYRKTQEALRTSEHQYRMLFENMTPGFALCEMIYGEEGKVVDIIFTQVNPAFEKLSGIEASNLLGRSANNLWPSADNKQNLENITIADSGTPIDFERYSGITHKYYDVRLFSPTPHFIAMLYADITERKQHETELKIAKEKAEESDRLKSAFLANMSHEIRTPMNGVLGFADLLKQPDLTPEEQHEYITVIEQSGQRMLNVLNDLLSISKIESGQIKVSISQTNVNEQLECIRTFFKMEANQKAIQLSLTCPLPDKECMIMTDTEKFYAVLTNLMKNAIKFTEKGSVSFGYEPQPGWLLFYVKDTGIGIPKEKINVVFERFQQVQIGLSRSYEGAGLGLSICKAYVELLGGSIWVESEEGKGSQFYFTLPYNGTI